MTTAFLVLTPGVASAHNSLVESNPQEGAILDSVPREWVLTFKNDVPLNSASAEVVAESGIRTSLASPRHGSSQKEVVFSLPENLAGKITGRWKLVSTDGHVVSARVSFTVSGATSTMTVGAADSTTSTSPTTERVDALNEATTPEISRFLLRLIGYSAILVYGGLVLNALLIGNRFLSFALVGKAALGAASILFLAPFGQLLVFLDDSRDFGIVGSVPHLLDSFDTTAGSMLLLRTLIGAVLLVALVKRVSIVATSGVVLATMYLFTLSYVGHSRSMAWPLLGVPVDVVHMGAVAVWLGGLAVFAFLVLPNMSPSESLASFRRFGGIAQAAVIAIVVTGVLQTFRLHGTLVTLFTETHGRWLVVKLLFVAAMLKIGDINRRRILRNLPPADDIIARHVTLVRRASITEIVTGGLVMIITTILVTSSFG